jgi:virulence-associated protein VagC
MKLKVTDAGVSIPREMFPDIEEVDVRVEGRLVILTPVRDLDDPLWQMGDDAVPCALPDASENHDRYLYQTDP